MPRYLAKNCFNELLQSFRSNVVDLLISEEIPQVELTGHDALESFVPTFSSTHPWLQVSSDFISAVTEFKGLNFTEINICEELQRLPGNSSSAILGWSDREDEWCLPRSQLDSCSAGCCSAGPCDCCMSLALPTANNWMDVKYTADNVVSQLFLEDVFMVSPGCSSRVPLVSELVRRLKPAVVPDPIFGETNCAISEAMIFKNEITPFHLLLLEQEHVLHHCTQLYVEDESDCNGIDPQQNLVLEEPMVFSGSASDRLFHLQPTMQPQSVLDEFQDEFDSAEVAVLCGEELCKSAIGVATEDLISAAPAEVICICMPPSEKGDGVKREPSLLLESPILESSAADPFTCAPSLGYLAVDVEEEDTSAELREASDRFLLSRVSEEEMLGELWQNEKYLDEIQLLAIRECRREPVVCDGSLGLMTAWSAVETLSLTPEEIASSQELNLAWDPLHASYGLMAAAERHCMEPAVQHSWPKGLLDSTLVLTPSVEWSGNPSGVQHTSPFLQANRTVKTFQQGNVNLQDIAEAGQCVYPHHLDNFSRKHQAPAACLAADSWSSSSSSRDVSVQLLDPLDQFLMLRQGTAAAAAASKGSAVTALHGQADTVVGGGGSSSLVAIVQPSINSASATRDASSKQVPVQRTMLDASSGSVFPSFSRSSTEADSKTTVNPPAPSTVINVSLSAPPIEMLLRLLEDAAHPFLVLLRRSRILVSEQSFNSLQSDVMGFIVRQQQNDCYSAVREDQADGDLDLLKMDLLRAAICVQCLVSVREQLMDACLSCAAQTLSLMRTRLQHILGTLLDSVLQKVLLEQVRHNEDLIQHPKALEMCRIIQQFHSTISRSDSKSKILVILPPSSSGVTMTLGQYLSEILTSVEGTRPAFVSSSLLSITNCDKYDAYNCYLLASNHLTDDWPWTEFALVIEYSLSSESNFREKCLLAKVPFVGLRSYREMSNLTTDDENGDEAILRSCLRPISLVMSHGLTAKHRELVHLLEARHNVVVIDRDYASLVASGYFEDVAVDGGSTVIVIEDLTVLRRKQEMERLVMRVSGLRQKSVACWILVFSTNIRPSQAADSPDLYSTKVIINISKLQASLCVLADPDFQIKVIFCHSYISMAMRIRQIASAALSQVDSRGVLNIASSPTIEPTLDERFFLSFPSLNSISAQMLLRIGSLKTLLTMPRHELIERSSSLPSKILQAFLEFRESVGEIFLILRQAGHKSELGISPSKWVSSSEYLCPSSPLSVTYTGWPMTTDWTEEGDSNGWHLRNEEEEEEAPRFKTHCLLSPKLNDFQEAEMFGENFAAFLSNLKSDSSDEMKLGTDEMERFSVHLDDNDVPQIDANRVLAQKLDRQFAFCFTDSDKSSTRYPVMSRSEMKFSADQVHCGDSLALKTSAAPNHCNFKPYNDDHMETTCCSVNPTNVKPVKIISDIMNSIDSNSLTKKRHPLGTHSPASGCCAASYEGSNVLLAEDRSSFSNDQEMKELQPMHRGTTGLNDLLSDATCSRTQLEFGNTLLPGVGIGSKCVADFYPGTNDVHLQRFRQPVQSLTLDGDRFSARKSTGNFWNKARSRHSVGHRWLFQQSSPVQGASTRKRKLTFERDDAATSGQTKLKFI